MSSPCPPVGRTCAKFVQPAPWQRQIWYPVTPTLSVAAPQERSISLGPLTDPVSVPGADGGCVSVEPPIGVAMSVWIAAAEREVVDADLVDQALEELAVDDCRPPIWTWFVEVAIVPVFGLRVDERAVDVEAEVRAVVREREERPRVGGERGRPEGVSIASAEGAAACGPAARGRGRLEVVVVVPFVDHVTPRVRDGRRVDPGLERHAGRELQRAELGMFTRALVPLKESAAPVLPCGRPGRVGEVPVLPLPDASAVVVHLEAYAATSAVNG